jgi:hypothetical protein
MDNIMRRKKKIKGCMMRDRGKITWIIKCRE